MRTLSIAALVWGLTALGSAPVDATCAGDCDGDGEVTVDELILGVNIALGSAAAGQCTPMDANGDGEVTIDEIIGAVNTALGSCPAPEPRLIAVSRDGRIAALDIAAPWTVRASTDLGATVASARCRDGRCLIVHPSPADSISVVAAADLAATGPAIRLDKGADPRDVALVGDRIAVISQYGKAELLEVDLTTGTTASIDLSLLADDDGLPEALRMAVCDRRIFVQLRRVDHETTAPAPIGAALAVIDFDATGKAQLVDADPTTAGVQGITLAGRPNFDMPVDCAAGVLYIAEPAPLFQGGGDYEQVDLATLTAHEYPVDTGAQVGGFEVVAPNLYWLITHTDIGPGPSSHLNLMGDVISDTYNTFANEHIDDLALDRDTNQLFFPDACSKTTFPACDPGIQVFNAHTGARLTSMGIDVGFPPIEVVVSR